jgi:hypothetical protein
MEPITYQILQDLDDYLADAKKQYMSQPGTSSDGFSIGSGLVRKKLQEEKVFFVDSQMYDELSAAIELLNESVRRGFLFNPENPKTWMTDRTDFDQLKIDSEAGRFIWDYLGSVRSVIRAIQVDYNDTVQTFRRQTRQLLLKNAAHAKTSVTTIPLGSYQDSSTPDLFNGEFEADLHIQPDKKVSAKVYKVRDGSTKAEERELWGEFEIDGKFISGNVEYLYFTRTILSES